MATTKVQDVGHAVRDARVALGLTQGEVADRAGVTRYWVTNLERGKANPTFSSLVAVLAAVGLSLRVTPESSDAERPAGRELPPPIDLEAVLARTKAT